MLELAVQDFLTVAQGSSDRYIHTYIYIHVYNIYIYIYIGSSNRVVLETLTRISDEHLANAARIHQHIQAQNACVVQEAFKDSGFLGFGK
jgi:hypothetical protein